MSNIAAQGDNAADIRAAKGERRQRLRQILRSATFLVGIGVLLFWTFCAVFGPSLVPYDPYAADVMNGLSPPSADHWFGTDQLGRDVFSRVIVGSRDILTVAPIATLLGTVLGTALGLMMGYFRGWLDDSISRFVDALLALPTVIIALLALVALGASNVTVVFVIAFTFAPLIARTVRAAVLVERELDYVAAAQLRRENAIHVMLFEILPNILPPILVETTVRLGYAIFTVATLSFIGFGIQPPSPDWGLEISTNYGMISAGAWWTVMFDGLAIASLVVGLNLAADGIQSAFDA
jgi:peptide/nickel transport system permease protein